MRYQKQIRLIILLFIISINATNLYPQETIEVNPQERVFDANFKERYEGRKFNYEGKKTVGTSTGGSGNYTDFKEKEKNPKIEEENNKNSFNLFKSLGFLNWIFIFALFTAVLYLVYVLLGEESLGLFRRNSDQKIGQPENFTAENIADTDVDSLIEQAENSNDYRLAIRYYYILVLKKLSLKNYIKLEEDKTNAEYFNEIKSQKFSENFAYTSYLYNYIWYGEFFINKEEYTTAKGNFIHLLKKIER